MPIARSERQKAIANAVAVASQNAFVPIAVRVGLAAMAEELAELRAMAHAPFDFTDLVRRIEELEKK